MKSEFPIRLESSRAVVVLPAAVLPSIAITTLKMSPNGNAGFATNRKSWSKHLCSLVGPTVLQAESALLGIVPTRPIVSIDSNIPKNIVYVWLSVYPSWQDGSR